MFTHNQTIDLLKQIAEKHPAVHSMGSGDYPDIASTDLRLYVDTSNDQRVVYPLLWVVPLSATVNEKETTTEYDILIMDLVQLDNSNQDEVLSDTLQLIHDVIAVLQNPDFSPMYQIDYPVSCTPFMEAYDDQVAGWSAKVNFRTQNLRDRCAVPLTSSITISTDTQP